MNDRIFQALSAAGLSTSPLSVLDHASTYASAFFALYDTELLYHEGGRNSQVPLRDVTRIHSDREGVLRVETSERTAVTASLVGYDPGRVQAFFQQVRDVTARAKELPVVPLQPKTELPQRPDLPGSSVAAAAMPGLSAYTPAAEPSAPVVPPSAASVSTAPTVASPAAVSPEPVSPAPLAVPPVSAAPAVVVAPVAPATPAPAPATPSPVTSSPVTVTATRRESPRPEPVVISSMPPVSDPPPFQERAGERNRQAVSQANRAAQRENEPDTGAAHTQGPLASVPLSRPLDSRAPERDQDAGTPNEAAGLAAELQRRAEGVQGLARTVALLAVVLGLAAIALAFFQWQGTGTSGNGTLSAIWTLLAGGVGTVALLAFAEALRLLSALARTAQQRA